MCDKDVSKVPASSRNRAVGQARNEIAFPAIAAQLNPPGPRTPHNSTDISCYRPDSLLSPALDLAWGRDEDSGDCYYVILLAGAQFIYFHRKNCRWWKKLLLLELMANDFICKHSYERRNTVYQFLIINIIIDSASFGTCLCVCAKKYATFYLLGCYVTLRYMT